MAKGSQEDMNAASMRKRTTEPKTKALRAFKSDSEFQGALDRRQGCQGLRGLAVRDYMKS